MVGLVLAAGALGAWLLWSSGRGAHGLGPAPVESSPSPPNGRVIAAAREEFFPAEAPRPAAGESEDDDEEEDPPTPAIPGPEQALLRVRALALESGTPLAAIELDLFALDDAEAEYHDWRSSTRADPSRGVENDTVRTRADGTGEFLVEAGLGYGLRGRGTNGRADEATLELGSFRADEERAVTLLLPTRWTHLWHGRAVDASSEAPLVGVEVRAFARASQHGEVPTALLTRGVSGADGQVQLLLPAWESATAEFRLPGYAVGSIYVEREEQDGAEPQKLLLRRASTLTFAVQDDAQRPAAGVELRLKSGGFVDGIMTAWSQVTDELGLATVVELPSSVPLWVSAWRDGRSLGQVEPLENTIVLAPGEHRRIEVRLYGTGSVAGRLLDPRGAPLVGVAVQAVGPNNRMKPSPLLTDLQRVLFAVDRIGMGEAVQADATTDSDGRFEFPTLPIGFYHVGAAPGGDVPALGKLLLVRESETSAIEIVLERALWIRGRVLDPRGEPASDIELTCTGQDEENSLTFMRASTESDGSFALGPLLRGRNEVRWIGGGDDHTAPFEPLDVDAGTEGLELGLVLGGTLAIELENARDGERCEVWMRRVGSSVTSGRQDQLAPGPYEVLAVSDEGRFALEHGVVIAGGRDHTLTLTLSPGATITLPEDAGAIHSFRISVDEFTIWPRRAFTVWPRREGQTVPPGRVRVEGQAWSPRGRLETVLVRERDLAPGDSWVVDVAD